MPENPRITIPDGQSITSFTRVGDNYQSNEFLLDVNGTQLRAYGVANERPGSGDVNIREIRVILNTRQETLPTSGLTLNRYGEQWTLRGMNASRVERALNSEANEVMRGLLNLAVDMDNDEQQSPTLGNSRQDNPAPSNNTPPSNGGFRFDISGIRNVTSFSRQNGRHQSNTFTINAGSQEYQAFLTSDEQTANGGYIVDTLVVQRGGQNVEINFGDVTLPPGTNGSGFDMSEQVRNRILTGLTAQRNLGTIRSLGPAPAPGSTPSGQSSQNTPPQQQNNPAPQGPVTINIDDVQNIAAMVRLDNGTASALGISGNNTYLSTNFNINIGGRDYQGNLVASGRTNGGLNVDRVLVTRDGRIIQFDIPETTVVDGPSGGPAFDMNQTVRARILGGLSNPRHANTIRSLAPAQPHQNPAPNPQPQQNTPAQPQQNTPAQPQQNTPAQPQQNTPAQPQQNTPAQPQQNAPSQPNNPAQQGNGNNGHGNQQQQQQQNPPADQGFFEGIWNNIKRNPLGLVVGGAGMLAAGLSGSWMAALAFAGLGIAYSATDGFGIASAFAQHNQSNNNNNTNTPPPRRNALTLTNMEGYADEIQVHRVRTSDMPPDLVITRNQGAMNVNIVHYGRQAQAWVTGTVTGTRFVPSGVHLVNPNGSLGERIPVSGVNALTLDGTYQRQRVDFSNNGQNGNSNLRLMLQNALLTNAGARERLDLRETSATPPPQHHASNRDLSGNFIPQSGLPGSNNAGMQQTV